MARAITLKQRVSLDSSGTRLRVSQNQNGRIRNTEIALKQPVRGTRNLHTITAYAHDWPRTEIDVTTPEFLPNQRPEQEQ